jgi:hypothetical protein
MVGGKVWRCEAECRGTKQSLEAEFEYLNHIHD